jgi:hypothetical protein
MSAPIAPPPDNTEAAKADSAVCDRSGVPAGATFDRLLMLDELNFAPRSC